MDDIVSVAGLTIGILGLLGGLVAYYSRRLEAGRKAFAEVRERLLRLECLTQTKEACEKRHSELDVLIGKG